MLVVSLTLASICLWWMKMSMVVSGWYRKVQLHRSDAVDRLIVVVGDDLAMGIGDSFGTSSGIIRRIASNLNAVHDARTLSKGVKWHCFVEARCGSTSADWRPERSLSGVERAKRRSWRLLGEFNYLDSLFDPNVGSWRFANIVCLIFGFQDVIRGIPPHLTGLYLKEIIYELVLRRGKVVLVSTIPAPSEGTRTARPLDGIHQTNVVIRTQVQLFQKSLAPVWRSRLRLVDVAILPAFACLSSKSFPSHETYDEMGALFWEELKNAMVYADASLNSRLPRPRFSDVYTSIH
jgi:hypothetical protein